MGRCCVDGCLSVCLSFPCFKPPLLVVLGSEASALIAHFASCPHSLEPLPWPHHPISTQFPVGYPVAPSLPSPPALLCLNLTT